MSDEADGAAEGSRVLAALPVGDGLAGGEVCDILLLCVLFDIMKLPLCGVHDGGHVLAECLYIHTMSFNGVPALYASTPCSP